MDINNRVSSLGAHPQAAPATGKSSGNVASSAAPAAAAAPKPVSLPEKASIKVPEFEPKDIQKAIAELQQYVDGLGRNLNFSVDESIDRTVISVRDAQTQELVRQIPGEEVIAMSRQIADTLAEWRQGFFFDSKI
jgi:flagellar protein FlaG